MIDEAGNAEGAAEEDEKGKQAFFHELFSCDDAALSVIVSQEENICFVNRRVPVSAVA